MSNPRPLSAANASDRPSRDQAGSRSIPVRPVSRERPSRPSGEDVQISSRYEKARRRPSGDQAGSRAPRGAGAGVCAEREKQTAAAARSEQARRAEAGRRITSVLRASLPDRLHDVPGGDAVAIHQLVRLTAAWNLTDRKPADGHPGRCDRLADRVTDAAGRVMILDGDHDAVGRARGIAQRRCVDRLNGIHVDDADGNAVLLQLIVGLERFEDRDAGRRDRRDVRIALPQHLRSADRELLVVS